MGAAADLKLDQSGQLPFVDPAIGERCDDGDVGASEFTHNNPPSVNIPKSFNKFKNYATTESNQAWHEFLPDHFPRVSFIFRG
jgi:hypothetical protein